MIFCVIRGMPPDNKDIEYSSDYPAITVPDFKPEIPNHLLSDLTPEMRHLIEQGSVQAQAMKWLCEKMRDTNVQIRKTNGRLKKVEAWREKLTGFTSVSITVIVVMSSVMTLIYKVIEFLQKAM
jgi:hypothetical protein